MNCLTIICIGTHAAMIKSDISRKKQDRNWRCLFKLQERSPKKRCRKMSTYGTNSSNHKNRSAMQTCVAYELPWSQRFFLPLRGSGSLILCREKSRKSSVTGVLNSPFFTYHWNPVDFPVCRFGYKKWIITRLVQVWIIKKIVGEAWQIAGE